MFDKTSAIGTGAFAAASFPTRVAGNEKMATNDGRMAMRGRLRGFRWTTLATLALGALLCAGTVLAQTAPLTPEVGPAAPTPAEAAPAAPPVAPPGTDAAAPAAESAAPPADTASPPPRITEALLPSNLPRDLSPWGMFLSAVVPVKIVMVGLALASSRPGRSGSLKSIELWNAKRLARRSLEILAQARSCARRKRN